MPLKKSTAVWLIAAAALLTHCASEGDVGADGPIERDTVATRDTAVDLSLDSEDSPLDAAPDAAPDTAIEDLSPDLPSEPDLPPDVNHADAIFEDSFDRPDLAMDVFEDPEEEPDADEPDLDEPDTDESGFWRTQGQYECLRYALEVQSGPFVWGQDLILIIWDVRNICSRPWRMRVQHEGDFLPIIILKDGEPWLSYPDCFGQGEPLELAYEGGGNGLRQGWLWIGAEHQTWVDRCAAAPFDPDAEYTVVGYGATEVAATDIEWSDVSPMSDPLPLALTPP